MKIIYSFAMSFYSLAIKMISPFNNKAKLMKEGRKDLFKRLNKDINNVDNYIWIHAASLGEFEQGRPVIEKIRKDYPQYKLLLTFFSPSGYEVRKNYDGVDLVYYLPLDSATNARNFIDIVNPKMVFFIKYEYWYFFLRELKKRDIPTFIFSSIFLKEQIFFKFYGAFWRNILKSFTHIFVQTKESISLLNSIGINNCSIAGDTRFDRVAEIAKSAPKISIIEDFKGLNNVVVCGSTWPKDEEFLSQYIKSSNDDFKWIIAPHEVHKKHINDIVKLFDNKCVLYSSADSANLKDAKILIVDCIGILSSVYQYACISYIGGGFGVGIHNTLEAATFGLPIVFGPNYSRFKEACDLIDSKAAYSYSEYSQLFSIMNKLIQDEMYRNESGNKSSEYVGMNIGATDIILTKAMQK